MEMILAGLVSIEKIMKNHTKNLSIVLRDESKNYDQNTREKKFLSLLMDELVELSALVSLVIAMMIPLFTFLL
jgi:hypothetical protein